MYLKKTHTQHSDIGFVQTIIIVIFPTTRKVLEANSALFPQSLIKLVEINLTEVLVRGAIQEWIDWDEVLYCADTGSTTTCDLLLALFLHLQGLRPLFLLLVEIGEVVDNDWHRKRNDEHTAYAAHHANYFAKKRMGVHVTITNRRKSDQSPPFQKNNNQI